MPAALLDLDIFSAEREPGRESAFLILLAFLLRKGRLSCEPK
jgi:hypothetical protein